MSIYKANQIILAMIIIQIYHQTPLVSMQQTTMSIPSICNTIYRKTSTTLRKPYLKVAAGVAITGMISYMFYRSYAQNQPERTYSAPIVGLDSFVNLQGPISLIPTQETGSIVTFQPNPTRIIDGIKLYGIKASDFSIIPRDEFVRRSIEKTPALAQLPERLIGPHFYNGNENLTIEQIRVMKPHELLAAVQKIYPWCKAVLLAGRLIAGRRFDGSQYQNLIWYHSGLAKLYIR